MFGMVLQDTWLNSGTIRENIRYGRRDATDEEVDSCCKGGACIDHFIRDPAEGVRYGVQRGSNQCLPGAEAAAYHRQSILADTPILILDEATSSVDTRTEALIQKAMAITDAGTDQLHHRSPSVYDQRCRP